MAYTGLSNAKKVIRGQCVQGKFKNKNGIIHFIDNSAMRNYVKNEYLHYLLEIDEGNSMSDVNRFKKFGLCVKASKYEFMDESGNITLKIGRMQIDVIPRELVLKDGIKYTGYDFVVSNEDIDYVKKNLHNAKLEYKSSCPSDASPVKRPRPNSLLHEESELDNVTIQNTQQNVEVCRHSTDQNTKVEHNRKRCR